MKHRNQKAAWYLFDMGSSAHALLVSAVGFSLYFREELFSTHQNQAALWGILTAIVLGISAILSPLVSSWYSHANRRGIGLLISTLISITATGLLAIDANSNVIVGLYAVSAVGYYLALPLYNGYLPIIAPNAMQTSSARGWALGYLGGIFAVLLTLVFGILGDPINYRGMFIVAALFNLILSLPLLFLARTLDRGTTPTGNEKKWSAGDLFRLFNDKPSILKLLFAYWMVGETATIGVYFTAIFLAEYAGMPAATILILTLAVQFVAMISTFAFGELAKKIGSGKPVFVIACIIWIVVPFLLWIVQYGYSYWIPIVAIGLVVGTYHTVVRAKVGDISDEISDEAQKGSLWGFLEVSGRVSQVLGPLVVGLVALITSLPNALLVSAVFPLAALVAIRKFEW